MAEDLFNYPGIQPPLSSSTSPRPKTSREKKRRRRHHHSTHEKQQTSNEKEEQQKQEEEEQQQPERPPLPSLNKDKNSRSSRELSQSNYNSKSDISTVNNSSSSKKNSRPIEDDNQFEEEEIDEVFYWTQEGIKDPSALEKCNPDLLPSVIICLKDTRDQCLVNGETDDSCIADVALTEARKIHKRNLVHIATRSMREDLEARLQEAEEALRELEETCEYQEDRMNKEMAKETANLLEKHKKETERLIATWTSTPPPPKPGEPEFEPGKTNSTTRPTTTRKKKRTTSNFNDTVDKSQTQDDDQFEEEEDYQTTNEDTERKFREYNKFSSQLRYLQDHADRLLKAKRYQESKAVEKQARELERIEVERNHFRMERDYNAALEALQVKQAAEIAKQEKSQDDRRKEYYHARDFDMTIAKRRIEKLQKEIADTEDPDKVWALHHRHDFEMPRPVNQQPGQTQTQDGTYSSRGVFETTASSTTGKASPFQERFNKLNLPPLKSGRSSRRIIERTERSFKFNKGYVFT